MIAARRGISFLMILRVDEASAGEAPILRNLAELYVHDLSEIASLELNDQGRFDHDFWRGCWSVDRTPYLIRVDGHLAGFAIVARGSRLTGDPTVSDIAEFFVVRRHRRHGIGTRAAASLFERRPGTWEVRQMEGHPAARTFWRNAIGAYTGGKFEELVVNDSRWKGWVQRFTSLAAV